MTDTKPQEVRMTDDQIKHMLDRFLQWKLPADFQPDAGISFQNVFGQHWPVGTNLFDAGQADAMVRFMAEGIPGTATPTTKWASPALDRAYQEVDKLRREIAQPSESGIDEALRAALDAIEIANTEIEGIAG